MLETAIHFFMLLLSDKEAKNKLPKDFVNDSMIWMNLWLPKEFFEKLSIASLQMADKHAFLEENLCDLLNIPQFELQLKEKLNQVSAINSGNAINNSTIDVQGNFSQTVNHYHNLPFPNNSMKHSDNTEAIIKVQTLVSFGQIKRALEVLKEATQYKFPSLHKETIQISGIWSDLARRERVGTISTEESSRMRAQINERIINTAEELLKAP